MTIRVAWAGVAAMVAAATLNAQGGSGTLDSLVKAERAFARLSVETSQRDAFLANFADDGVWFTPGPENTREAIRKQPAPPGPPARALDWEPALGDIAASGDLGYTTGPYVSTPRAADGAPRTGWFFSVWRWRPDTRWKVAADFGVEAPGSVALRPRTFSRAAVLAVKLRAKPDPKACAEELRAADAAFAALVTGRGLQTAYRMAATQDVLVFRPGVAPVAGRVAVMSVMPSAPMSLTAQPSYAEASRAGDLGFTYGSYAEAPEGRAETRGYYLHVWKRLASGWALAADVTNR
jgi:ketosteroid isomerase-like protein